MEFKSSLRLLLRRWWIILTIFIIMFTLTVWFTFTRVPLFEATSTFLVVPTTAEVGRSLSAMNLLSTRSEMGSTYAEVASSHSVKRRAVEKLGISDPNILRSLLIQSRLLPGTIVLQITTQGNDAQIVQDFTNQVGVETIEVVNEHYEIFSLESLDPARLPTAPVSPNIPLNLSLGAVVGLILGFGLAILSVYFETSEEQVSGFAIIDKETGAYNRRYFTQRLAEEMSRAKRNGYPMSLALMNLDHLGVIASSTEQVRAEALRRISLTLKQYLRDEDIMAHFGKAVFAFLLPDMSGVSSRETLEKLQTRIAWTPLELENSSTSLNLSSTAGVVAYQLDSTSADELLSQVSRALEEAEIAGFGKVQLADGSNGAGKN